MLYQVTIDDSENYAVPSEVIDEWINQPMKTLDRLKAFVKACEDADVCGENDDIINQIQCSISINGLVVYLDDEVLWDLNGGTLETTRD